MKVEFSRRALREIERIARWWRKHRDAKFLFDEELRSTVEEIRVHADDPSYEPKIYRIVGDRVTYRELMKTTRYHVYYRVEQDLVLIQCVWGAQRGREPKL